MRCTLWSDDHRSRQCDERQMRRSRFYEMSAPLLNSRQRYRADSRAVPSGLQVELMEFLRRRAEVAEVVNGCACRRKRERFKRFGEHLVQILSGGEAGGDMRMVILAGMIRLEVRNVGNQLREELGIFGRSEVLGRVFVVHQEVG